MLDLTPSRSVNYKRQRQAVPASEVTHMTILAVGNRGILQA